MELLKVNGTIRYVTKIRPAEFTGSYFEVLSVILNHKFETLYNL